MKYVVIEHRFRSGGTRQVVPVIFPSNLVHADVAEAVCEVLRSKHGFSGVRPVSAGDFSMVSGVCSGKSETLKLKSKKGDSNLILSYDYTGGML